MGRPSKLTVSRKGLLLEAVKLGQPYERACRLAGITFSTMRNWIVRGEKAKSGVYFEFLQELKLAESEGEQNRLLMIQNAALDGHWQAAAWIQERRFPETWGRRLDLKANVRNPEGEAATRDLARKFDQLLKERGISILPLNEKVKRERQDDWDSERAQMEAGDVNFQDRAKCMREGREIKPLDEMEPGDASGD